MGLGATPLRSYDLQPRNPHLCAYLFPWSGVAPSPRLQRDVSLREGHEPASGRVEPAAGDGSGRGGVLDAGEGIEPPLPEAADDLVGQIPDVGEPEGLRRATEAPREVCELALAHVNRDRVEAAYRRSDLFERRRALMEQWAAFLAGTGVSSST